MSPELSFHFPLAGVAALVLLYFLIRAWKFGILRPLLTTLSLAAGVAAAYYVYHNIAPLLEMAGIGPNHLTMLGCAIVAASWVFFILRKLGHRLSNRAYDPESFGGRIGGGPVGAFLSIIPAILFIAVIATGLRRIATIAELAYIDTCSALYSTGKTIYPDTPYSVKLCSALESIPRSAEFFTRVDPACDIARRHLAGLGLISRNDDLYLAIGGRQPIAAEIYAHPRVAALLGALEVNQLLDARDHQGVLANELVQEIAELPGLTDQLESIDVIDTLHTALGM